MQDLLLLSKDIPIAKIRNCIAEPLIPERLPLYFKYNGNARLWLESRAVDGHRTNSRLLKKVLRLAHKDDLTTVLAVNAATITDNFWVKPLDDNTLGYSEVRFKINLFDNLALTGSVDSFDQPPGRTPELTNTGSFEKCWRLENGQWWMYKSGKEEELFSELLAYKIGKLLNCPMAEYRPADGFIKSLDFTGNARVDFEPVAGIIGDEFDYIKIYNALRAISADIAKQYVLMCYFDGLIFNMDRHEYNFGVLRNCDTGEVLGSAPFFDHNVALVARGYPGSIPKDMLITDFAALIQHIGNPIHIIKLTESKIRDAVHSLPFTPPSTNTVLLPKEFTVQYLLRRQEALKDYCSDLIQYTD